MSLSLSAITRSTAVTGVLLISPAALFMGALVVRAVGAIGDGPTHTAQQIVMWYAERPWTLWVLLIGLPLAVLVTGLQTLLRNWNQDAELRRAVRRPAAAIYAHLVLGAVATTTVTAGGILTIVAVHVLAN